MDNIGKREALIQTDRQSDFFVRNIPTLLLDVFYPDFGDRYKSIMQIVQV
jgi:hypothetical protein